MRYYQVHALYSSHLVHYYQNRDHFGAQVCIQSSISIELSMQVSNHTSPEAQSLGDLEKDCALQEKEDMERLRNGDQHIGRTLSQSGAADIQARGHDKEQTRCDINPIDWNGPDDPDNPHNCTIPTLSRVGRMNYALIEILQGRLG
jgi:hypothetical protein